MRNSLSAAIAVLVLAGFPGCHSGVVSESDGAARPAQDEDVQGPAKAVSAAGCPLEQMGVTCPCGDSCPAHHQADCPVCFGKAGRMTAAALQWRSAMQAKDYDRALEAARLMDEIVPGNSNIKASFALVYNLRGEYGKALTVYQEMLKDFPDNPTIVGNIANSYLLMGDYDRALVIYRELAGRYPDEPSILNALASALIKKGDLPGALEVYGKILRVRPDDAATLYNISCAYALNGVNDKACLYLEKAAGCGYYDWRQIESDSDLDGIRSESVYNRLVDALKSKYPDSANPKGDK